MLPSSTAPSGPRISRRAALTGAALTVAVAASGFGRDNVDTQQAASSTDQPLTHLAPATASQHPRSAARDWPVSRSLCRTSAARSW